MKNYSWKTTGAAIAGMITAVISLVINPLTDNDPTTLPQYGAAASVIVTALIGLFARDDNKTSAQVGAGK